MLKILKSFFILFSVLILASLATNSYFSDNIVVSGNSFQTGIWPTTLDVVINEVYYDVASGQTEGQNEWVEIYNNENDPVNLKNWKIKDNTATERIFINDFIIPGKSYALITNKPSTWAFWPLIPIGTVKYELNANIGSGLNNTGDSVILKDSSSNIISQMSYSSGFDGHSWERNPAITGSFIDNSLPTPGY